MLYEYTVSSKNWLDFTLTVRTCQTEPPVIWRDSECNFLFRIKRVRGVCVWVCMCVCWITLYNVSKEVILFIYEHRKIITTSIIIHSLIQLLLIWSFDTKGYSRISFPQKIEETLFCRFLNMFCFLLTLVCVCFS